MTDTCKHCTVRGNIVTCRAIPCHTHDSWYAQQQDAEIERLHEVIDRAANAWMSLEPQVAWEGDVADAMAAGVAEIERLREALEFYADPETYFGIAVIGDSPCGAFVEDFSDDHGHPYLDGPRYGKVARAALLASNHI